MKKTRHPLHGIPANNKPPSDNLIVSQSEKETLRFQKVICLTTAFNIKPLPEPDQQHGRLKAYVYISGWQISTGAWTLFGLQTLGAITTCLNLAV